MYVVYILTLSIQTIAHSAADSARRVSAGGRHVLVGLRVAVGLGQPEVDEVDARGPAGGSQRRADAAVTVHIVCQSTCGSVYGVASSNFFPVDMNSQSTCLRTVIRTCCKDSLRRPAACRIFKRTCHCRSLNAPDCRIQPADDLGLSRCGARGVPTFREPRRVPGVFQRLYFPFFLRRSF